MDKVTQDLFLAYLDVAESGSGKLVMEDMRTSFIELGSEALLEELEQFPHPYRAYVEKGMAMVVHKMEATVKTAEHYQLHGFPDDDREVNDDEDNLVG